jgi:hypothetical protein
MIECDISSEEVPLLIIHFMLYTESTHGQNISYTSSTPRSTAKFSMKPFLSHSLC